MSVQIIVVSNLVLKAKHYLALLKLRLSMLVVFSAAFGYLLAASTDLNQLSFIAFCAGSFLITGAANAINQIMERDLDKLMRRTANRPLPIGALSPKEASVCAIVLAITGLVLLLIFANVFSAVLALLSLILYAFVYTPLKQKTAASVFVGAFPGAFPPLIGWIAAKNDLAPEALSIFAIQFIWQFPHFWSIAWIADQDYQRAGFKLLPSGGNKDFNTAFYIAIYTLFLIPLGMLPMQFGITGVTSAVVAVTCGVLFLLQSIRLLWKLSDSAAKSIMFASFLYLPIVQIAFLLDKI
ncbi:MAG: heme o synthase [Cytophagales bacterium]|nr:heme o synthase [Bernardetiaceae bacterium]MDW8211073.1 heme o synthase [Cytophagales bacterium]